jgi:hypothetical protein
MWTRIENLESENLRLTGQEEARLMQTKLHRAEVASFKWALLVEKMLRSEGRKSSRFVALNLRRRITVLQERLTKFADGQRLKSKAGGARTLTYDALQLLSPRTATPVVSDDEGRHCPPSSAVRMRLARAKGELEDAAGPRAASLSEPGLLGDLEVNRAGTPRDTARAMTRSIAKALNDVSFRDVVRTPEANPRLCAGPPPPHATPGATELRSFCPWTIGATITGDDDDDDDDQSLQAIHEQWVALFDGNGTDPGCVGAKPVSSGAAPGEQSGGGGDADDDDDDATAAMPFVGARPPGNYRRGARASRRYRRGKEPAEELPRARRQPHFAEGSSAGGETGESCLDSARELTGEQGGAVPEPDERAKFQGHQAPSAVPVLDLRGLGAPCDGGRGESPLKSGAASTTRRRAGASRASIGHSVSRSRCSRAMR